MEHGGQTLLQSIPLRQHDYVTTQPVANSLHHHCWLLDDESTIKLAAVKR
jgi:hypothetical protein